MKILSMRFKSSKLIPELEKLSEDSFPKFPAVPGLVQKHWVRNRATGEVGGIYLWDDDEALQAYLAGPIVRSIPERFDVTGDVQIEVLDLMYTLRPEQIPATP